MSDPLKLTELDLLPQWAREPMPEGRSLPFPTEEEPETFRQRPERTEREERGGRRRDRDRRGSGTDERRERSRGRDGGGRTERASGGKPRGGGGGRGWEERRAEPVAPVPDLGLEVSFVPDPHGAESMARQIRSTCLAYPVFELAKVALKKEVRHQVVVKKTSSATVQLLQCKLDGSVWLERAAAAAHVVEKHLTVFYEEEQVAGEPPKGNFNALGICSLDGTVLGPVNHHDYQSNLRRLHQKKFARMAFEELKAKIQVVRDPERIEAWRQAQAVKTVFVPRPEPVLPGEPQVGESVALVLKGGSDASAEPGVSGQGAEVAGEQAKEAEREEGAEVAPKAEAGSGEERVEQGQAEGSAETIADGTNPKEGVGAGERVRLNTLAEVREHFLRTHADGFLVPVEEAILETVEARRGSAPEVQEQIRHALEQELRFPLKTAKVLIQQLGKFGLQFFKWGKGATFVSGIRPKRFESDPAALADGVRAVYEWVLAHPNGRRDQLFKAMTKRQQASPPEVEGGGATGGQDSGNGPAAAEPASASAGQPEPTEAAPPGATDLLWLVREGLVIAFADGRLDLIRGGPRKPEEKPRPEPGQVAVVTVGESTPNVSQAEPVGVEKGPAQLEVLPGDPSADPEAEREGLGDDPV